MKADRKIIWIKTGYEVFALQGLNGLQVEPIAKLVGKNKSSFYHHFSDLEIFLDELLAHHIAQVKLMCEKEKTAQSFNPDIIHIFVEHKIDILFNKQLRINHHHAAFKKVLHITDEGLAEVYTFLLKNDLKLNLKQKGIDSFFQLALNKFFLEINAHNINFQWLAAYFDEIKRLAKSFE
jgi:AcrR family transcriptional regulator